MVFSQFLLHFLFVCMYVFFVNYIPVSHYDWLTVYVLFIMFLISNSAAQVLN